MTMTRIIAASALLVAVNGAALLPALEPHRGTALGISVLLALYILIHAGLHSRRGREPVERPKGAKAPEAAAAPSAAGAGAATRDARVDAEIAHFLGILQEKGRFMDFVMDDITSYNNEQVGAAARVVHQGCSKVMSEYFSIVPLHEGAEGDSVVLQEGYNPAEYRPVGKLADGARIQGKITHRGWKATEIKLPRRAETAAGSEDRFVITPAEIDVR